MILFPLPVHFYYGQSEIIWSHIPEILHPRAILLHQKNLKIASCHMYCSYTWPGYVFILLSFIWKMYLYIIFPTNPSVTESHPLLGRTNGSRNFDITYNLVSIPTPWAVAAPHWQLASMLFHVNESWKQNRIWYSFVNSIVEMLEIQLNM